MHCYSDVLIGENPESVVIQAGTNDIWGRNKRAVTNGQVADDIHKLAEKFRSAGTNNILISSVPMTRINECNTRAMEINKIVQEQCAKRKYVYVDNTDLGRCLYDAVHLDATGIKRMVDRFTHLLK